MMDAASIVTVGGAALVAGAVNAIAGGGSLITFPALVAVGLPPVAASVTNTVALCPGYLGATLAQRTELAGQGGRLARLLLVGALGGGVGALLLLRTGDRVFSVIVPFLILAAALLVATQDRIRTWLFARAHAARAEDWAALPVALAAIYGGYFGAGLGVMLIAALGIVLAEPLPRVNALKQALSLSINVAAAIVFVIWGPIDWSLTLVMAGAALAGGVLGGLLATRISPRALRWLVVLIGLGVSGVYFAKLLRG